MTYQYGKRTILWNKMTTADNLGSDHYWGSFVIKFSQLLSYLEAAETVRVESL